MKDFDKKRRGPQTIQYVLPQSLYVFLYVDTVSYIFKWMLRSVDYSNYVWNEEFYIYIICIYI